LHLLVYDALVGKRTAPGNRLHAVVTGAPAEMRQEVVQIPKSSRIAALTGWRARSSDDVVASACRQVMRQLVRHVITLEQPADAASAGLDVLIDEAAPALHDL